MAPIRCSKCTCSITTGDLYGEYLSVDFLRWLRAEQKFESLDALVVQMHVDSARARAALAEIPRRA